MDMDSNGVLTTTSGTTLSTSNCIGYPYGITSYPAYTYSSPSKLGEFDFHLDSCGNLRVIQHGKIVGEFKPKTCK